MLDPSRYGVEVVPEVQARAFVAAHHYAKSWVASRLSVGLYEVGKGLVGVAVFAVPMQPKSITTILRLLHAQGVELSRFVLLDEVPGMAETWFLSRAFGLLRACKREVKGVISYSDPVPRTTQEGLQIKPGHQGIIYRAFSGRYVGLSSPRTLILAPDGRVVSGRSLSKIRQDEMGAAGAYRALLEMGAPRRLPLEGGEAYVRRAMAGFRRLRHPGNLTYCFGFTPATRRGFPPARPFPDLA